jgi:hypothetical protein
VCKIATTEQSSKIAARVVPQWFHTKSFTVPANSALPPLGRRDGEEKSIHRTALDVAVTIGGVEVIVEV